MSLRARLVVLCAFFVVVVVAASSYGSVLVMRANDARRHHSDLENAGAAAKDLNEEYIGQAESIRNFFLRNDAAALKEYDESRTAAVALNGRIQGLVMGTPVVSNMEAVNNAVRTWRVDVLQPLILLQQQGQSEAVIAGYRDGQVASAFADVADATAELRSAIRVEADRAGAAESQERQAVRRFAVGVILTAIAMFGFVLLVSRWWIAKPLREMSAAMRDTTPRDTPLLRRGAKELVRLADDIGALRSRLLGELELATRTREGLAQNAAVLMQVRAQLETSPDNLPTGWSVAAQLVPATGIVAGDCYTVDIVGRDTMTVVVVDVAGHGASSAVLALRAKELLRAAVRSYDDPSDAVTWASSQLTDLDDDMFVTAFVARVDFGSGLVRFVNAGHPEAIICDSEHVVELGPTGPLIGPFTAQWVTREALIGPGQMLVCYTDGLIEARDEDGEEFGLGRLHKVLKASYGDATETIVKKVLNEVDGFAHGRAHDDLTLTVVARSPRSGR